LKVLLLTAALATPLAPSANPAPAARAPAPIKLRRLRLMEDLLSVGHRRADVPDVKSLLIAISNCHASRKYL
jgi:hypothetical protein